MIGLVRKTSYSSTPCCVFLFGRPNPRAAKTPTIRASQSSPQVLGSGRTSAGNFFLPAIWDKWDRDQTTLGDHPLLDLIEHISWSCLRPSLPRNAASQPQAPIRQPTVSRGRRRSTSVSLSSPPSTTFRCRRAGTPCHRATGTPNLGRFVRREVPPATADSDHHACVLHCHAAFCSEPI